MRGSSLAPAAARGVRLASPVPSADFEWTPSLSEAGFVPLRDDQDDGQRIIGAISPQWIEYLDPGLFAPGPDGPGFSLVRPREGASGSTGEASDDVASNLAGDVAHAVHAPASPLEHALARWARRLKDAGRLPGWRGEQVQCPGFRIERSLLRPLGLRLPSVQLSVWRRGPDVDEICIGRRAMTKPVAPGLLDTLVGGGIVAGETIPGTLIREAWEEAGIPEAIARAARPAGAIEVCETNAEPSPSGPDATAKVLHREHLSLFELELPPAFTPRPQDGEVSELIWMRPEALATSLQDPGSWSNSAAWATWRLLESLRRTLPEAQIRRS